jgi:hypothetical protein
MKSLALAIAVICGATVGCAATTDAEPAAASTAPDPVVVGAFKQDMRLLWSDHVIWTRGYVVAAAADSPDQQAAAARLMKNQEDIGNAVADYYGKPAGDQLTALLKDHISIAVDLVKAAKAGDNPGVQAADARWQQNGVDIADFLSKANPNWPRQTLVDLMKTHLSTTTTAVKARLGKDWEADVRAFDEVYRHILMMSDTLADGIVKQFPDRFSTR